MQTLEPNNWMKEVWDINFTFCCILTLYIIKVVRIINDKLC